MAISWVGIYYMHSNGESPAQTLAAVQAAMTRLVTRFQCFENDGQLITAVGTAGGKVWVELASSVFSGTSGYNATNLATIVNATKNNVNVEGYFSNDEVDLKGFSVSVLQTAYADFKALTAKPLAMTIRYPQRFSGPNGRQYVDASPFTCDIIMHDPYNIPYGNAASIGAETQDVVAIPTRAGRPVYTIIQSFGWGTTFSPPYGRIPTVQEMRDMGTGAVTKGATNLWIYTNNGNVESPPNNPMANFNAACWNVLDSILTDWGAAVLPPDPPAGGGLGRFRITRAPLAPLPLAGVMFGYKFLERRGRLMQQAKRDQLRKAARAEQARRATRC